MDSPSFTLTHVETAGYCIFDKKRNEIENGMELTSRIPPLGDISQENSKRTHDTTCGVDDRQPSSDNRVVRLAGYIPGTGVMGTRTAVAVQAPNGKNKCFLTAPHDTLVVPSLYPDFADVSLAQYIHTGDFPNAVLIFDNLQGLNQEMWFPGFSTNSENYWQLNFRNESYYLLQYDDSRYVDFAYLGLIDNDANHHNVASFQYPGFKIPSPDVLYNPDQNRERCKLIGIGAEGGTAFCQASQGWFSQYNLRFQGDFTDCWTRKEDSSGLLGPQMISPPSDNWYHYAYNTQNSYSGAPVICRGYVVSIHKGTPGGHPVNNACKRGTNINLIRPYLLSISKSTPLHPCA